MRKRIGVRGRGQVQRSAEGVGNPACGFQACQRHKPDQTGKGGLYAMPDFDSEPRFTCAAHPRQRYQTSTGRAQQVRQAGYFSFPAEKAIERQG